ncbi:PREDICTED: uncharacterized protein LOC104814044 [Tarenaya hassleriana]|uniref:uncharacterized protein LOC104814044 n=1 Tax=Tarenaya hassleriana TaxID=28532 RepID=UPI00053C2858|nr:PREDICTED: uncharacterized protein LOC104814044 [Tarenaya hassleriana]
MKFFGWMQTKLSGKQLNNNSRPSTSSASHHLKQEPREEFSDWPHGLLAIGTFGTNNCARRDKNRKVQWIQEEASNAKHGENEDRNQEQDQDPSSSDDLEDFTSEEVGRLQKELTKLLSRTKKRKSDVHRELTNNLPLDRFLNCPSSLEVDRRISNTLCSIDPDDKEEDIERTISIILGRCKEISTENKNKKKKTDIGKTCVSYLLKKIFICREGFSSRAPSPSLRDTLQESRMEKFLRMMLHKKINPQASSRATSVKNYLQDKQRVSKNIEEEANEKSNDGCKWVKTDSDFIVLEI